MQVLPSFLEGEARKIAQAFGCGAEYALVKQKLVEEFSYRRTLGRTLVAEFLSAERRAGEMLRVYSIRLGELARGAFGVEIGSRDDMIKNKVLASLPSKLVQQINVQLRHQSESSLEQVVRLATVLEAQMQPVNSRVGVAEASLPLTGEIQKSNSRPRLTVCTYCEKVGHDESNCYLRNKTCFKCGEPGHFAKECTRRGACTDKTPGSSVGCAFCGKGQHALAECETFMRRCMACSWCGEVTHQSFQCKVKGHAGN